MGIYVIVTALGIIFDDRNDRITAKDAPGDGLDYPVQGEVVEEFRVIFVTRMAESPGGSLPVPGPPRAAMASGDIQPFTNYRKHLEPCLEILQPCTGAFRYKDS